MTLDRPIIKETEIWAYSPDSPDDVQKPSDTKIAEGFHYTEIPKHYHVNYFDNLITTQLYSLETTGVQPWNQDITYQKGAVVSYVNTSGNYQFYVSLENENTDVPEGSSKWRTEKNNLHQFLDTNFTSLQQDDIFYYDGATKEWKNAQESAPFINRIKEGYVVSNGAHYKAEPNDLEQIIEKEFFNTEYILKETDNGLVIDKETKSYNTTQIFTYNTDFQIPDTVTEISVHVIGGGGSGAIGSGDNQSQSYGGGNCGKHKHQVFQVTPLEILTIEIGHGGDSGLVYNGVESDGNPGGATTVYDSNNQILLRADGGKGGRIGGAYYRGNNQEKVSAIDGKTYNSGLFVSIASDIELKWMETWKWGNTYGGEASELSHGGSKSGALPKYGAGGCAAFDVKTPENKPQLNRGGNGICIIQYNL